MLTGRAAAATCRSLPSPALPLSLDPFYAAREAATWNWQLRQLLCYSLLLLLPGSHCCASAAAAASAFCLWLCRLVIVARRRLPTDSQSFPFRYVTARPTQQKKNNHTLHAVTEREREGDR